MIFKHRNYSWSLVVTRGHSWSLVVTRGHSWSFVVTRGHSWSLVVTRGHSWSLVVTRGHSCLLLDKILTCTVILSFGRKRGFGGPPPENFSIFEALGLQFWRFLKQIHKQIGCKLTVYFTKMVIISHK
jgi:hypothetical protein